METTALFPIIAAVIIGNGLCFLFFVAAVKCHRLQNAGAKDDELPWWVYVGLIAAPAMMAFGGYLLK